MHQTRDAMHTRVAGEQANKWPSQNTERNASDKNILADLCFSVT